jgi:hypothetical protein
VDHIDSIQMFLDIAFVCFLNWQIVITLLHCRKLLHIHALDQVYACGDVKIFLGARGESFNAKSKCKCNKKYTVLIFSQRNIFELSKQSAIAEFHDLYKGLQVGSITFS